MLRKGPNRRKSRPRSRSESPSTRASGRAENVARSTGFPTLKPAADRREARSFVLYVEGARDREILECWARRIDPALPRCIVRNTVILGGRRPARAILDFEKRGGPGAGFSGLIVLDRDDRPGPVPATDAAAKGAGAARIPGPDEQPHRAALDAGLEVFVWSLRHIESYLLVPDAIRRMLGLARDDGRIERLLQGASPGVGMPCEPGVGGTGRMPASLHAKRMLGPGGALSRALGVELRPGEIARAMKPEEFHADVHRLFDRIGALSGLARGGPEVVIRSAGPVARKTDS